MAIWKLEDAKNRFSELVRRANAEGPQLVTKHGREAAVVMAAEEYRRITQTENLADFLISSPFAEALRDGDLLLSRSRELGRNLDW